MKHGQDSSWLIWVVAKEMSLVGGRGWGVAEEGSLVLWNAHVFSCFLLSLSLRNISLKSL